MPQSEPRNLIVISLDTLRADVAYSGELKALECIRARGASFRNTVASAPITPVSHASVFTALQPYEHGLRHLLRNPLQSRKPTLAELLRDAGYQTAAVVACPGLNHWYQLDRGFQHYDDEVPRLSDGRDPLEVADVKIRGTALKRAPLVVERALDWLAQHRHRPFFLFVHFFDTHWPYDPPEWFAPAGINPYEGEAHYADHYLNDFITQVEDWGLPEQTVVAAFSDHGEDLAGWYPNDHAGVELGHPEEHGHGALLYDATQMVPMVVVAPGSIPPGINVDHQVRLVDLVPTLTDLLGITDPAKRAGESLRCFWQGGGIHRVAYCETYYREEQAMASGGIPTLGPWHGIRLANEYKIILDVNSGTTCVYDLAADPLERHAIAHGSGHGALLSHLSRLPKVTV